MNSITVLLFVIITLRYNEWMLVRLTIMALTVCRDLTSNYELTKGHFPCLIFYP